MVVNASDVPVLDFPVERECSTGHAAAFAAFAEFGTSEVRTDHFHRKLPKFHHQLHANLILSSDSLLSVIFCDFLLKWSVLGFEKCGATYRGGEDPHHPSALQARWKPKF